tara:strand:+ start:194 stop:562 length:369 start_codon:yes stop_codon:yes gene_type:complete
MGKAAKKHRAKVAKRNNQIDQKKSGMQKAFDLLVQEQLKKLESDKEISIQHEGQDLNFEVVEDKIVNTISIKPNEVESAKINKEFETQTLPEENIMTNVEYKERNGEMVYDSKHNSPTKEEN